jgi:hypothetical protein
VITNINELSHRERKALKYCIVTMRHLGFHDVSPENILASVIAAAITETPEGIAVDVDYWYQQLKQEGLIQ